MSRFLIVILLCFSYPVFASPQIVTAITSFFGSVLNGTTSHQTEGDNNSDFVFRQRELFKTLYDQALIFKNAGKIDEAISTMTQAVEIKEAQNSSRLYINAVNELALLHKEKGNQEEAVRYFKIALNYRSNKAAYELALIHTENEEWDQAEKLFKTAINYGYGYDATYELAKMYKESGQREQAIESIRPLLSTLSHNHEAEFFLKKIQAENGDVDAQIALANLYLIRGREYEEIGKTCPYFDEGEDYKERALYWMTKAAEKSINAKRNVAVIYKDRGDIEEAIKWMTKAAQEESFHPNPGSDEHFDTIAQYDLAFIYEERGNLEEAIHWMTKAAKQGFISAQEKLAEMHAKKGDLPEAIHWMTKVTSNKNDGSIRAFGREKNYFELSDFHKLALLHEANGDSTQAIHWMEKAAVRRGTESAVLAKIELAKMYEEDGNRQAAIQKLEEAKEFYCPTKGYHLLAKYELALLLEKEGDRKQAVEYMTQVAKFGRSSYQSYSDYNYYLAARKQLIRMHSEENEEMQTAYWKERTEPYNNLSVDTDPAMSFAIKFLPDSCHIALAGAGD